MLELGVEELGRSLISEELPLYFFRLIIALPVVIEFMLGEPSSRRLPNHKNWNKIVCDAG